MTYWRKLIRWLARKEIALEAAVHQFDKAAAVHTQSMISYMKGHHDGVMEATAEIEAALENAGKIGVEQIRAIKKRNVH